MSDSALAGGRRATLLGHLIEKRLCRAQSGSLTLIWPGGGRHIHRGAKTGPDARVHFVNRRGLRRLLFGGHNGFAEGVIEGSIDVADLTALFHWFIANETALGGRTRGPRLRQFRDRLWHLMRDNSRREAKRNISFHYDLGNEFYAAWLDPSMTYSSALFEAQNDSLLAAQCRKYDRIADRLGIDDTSNVLEIGCGWGGFAERALSRGARVTGLTISQQQLAYTRSRLAPFGGRADMQFCDYRDSDGKFDAIASIEMFEAVGEKHWPCFFQTVCDRLKKGGRAVIQVITIQEHRFERYRGGADFIQRFIFPGGMLPSPERFEAAARAAGLAVHDRFDFGPSYAETLRRWRSAFLGAWPKLRRQGFDERFQRMWLYYLSYCEAGFDAGSINVSQYELSPAT